MQLDKVGWMKHLNVGLKLFVLLSLAAWALALPVIVIRLIE